MVRGKAINLEATSTGFPAKGSKFDHLSEENHKPKSNRRKTNPKPIALPTFRPHLIITETQNWR